MNAADPQPVANELSFTEAIVCAACDWRGGSVAQAIGHEHNRHEGAQTCWWQRIDPKTEAIIASQSRGAG